MWDIHSLYQSIWTRILKNGSKLNELKLHYIYNKEYDKEVE